MQKKLLQKRRRTTKRSSYSRCNQNKRLYVNQFSASFHNSVRWAFIYKSTLQVYNQKKVSRRSQIKRKRPWFGEVQSIGVVLMISWIHFCSLAANSHLSSSLIDLHWLLIFIENSSFKEYRNDPVFKTSFTICHQIFVGFQMHFKCQPIKQMYKLIAIPISVLLKCNANSIYHFWANLKNPYEELSGHGYLDTLNGTQQWLFLNLHQPSQ